MSLNHLASRFTCTWPQTTLVMLCDGRVVCGCADPYAKRVLGDARHESIGDIWTGATATGLRRDLNAGGSSFCGDCPLKRPLEDGEAPPQRPEQPSALPNRLYVECTAACNLSCHLACCAPETGITRTREAGMLDVDLFDRVLAETGDSLIRLDFFNYGEAFLHKRAIEMCERVKARYPHIYLYTSTNGLAFSSEQARRLVHSGIDEVTFSIDGATQERYERYRRRGNLQLALDNLRAMVEEKRSAARDVPFINWRYILFTWNDSDEEMDRARHLAQAIGVDRLCWEITDHPEDCFSRRFAPGTDDYRRIQREIWDDNGLGNAIPGATPRASIEVRSPLGRLPFWGRPGRPFQIRTRVSNLCDRTFPAQASYGRRLVRLGAQLCDEHGRLLERDYARAWLPAPIEPGAAADVPIELTAPADAGSYRLKFDLVSEGVDWFEACGSPTTASELLVR
jgi:MoaA/NifB/PqqE/SkfB family radical SAM enzyme